MSNPSSASWLTWIRARRWFTMKIQALEQIKATNNKHRPAGRQILDRLEWCFWIRIIIMLYSQLCLFTHNRTFDGNRVSCEYRKDWRFFLLEKRSRPLHRSLFCRSTTVNSSLTLVSSPPLRIVFWRDVISSWGLGLGFGLVETSVSELATFCFRARGRPSMRRRDA